MDKRLLRGLTIILPVGFWLVVLYITNVIKGEQLSALEILISVALVSIGATFFSRWIFTFIDQREEEIRRRANQLEALNEAALALNAELDLGIVLQKVVDLSTELVNARYGALGVLDKEGAHFEQFLTSGIVACRAGRRPGALRTDAEDVSHVKPGDAAATGTDTGNINDRQCELVI